MYVIPTLMIGGIFIILMTATLSIVEEIKNKKD